MQKFLTEKEQQWAKSTFEASLLTINPELVMWANSLSRVSRLSGKRAAYSKIIR